MKIVETDNHDDDYPDEKFIGLSSMCEEYAKTICDAINDCLCQNDHARRFWKVVEDDYELVGGFEP